MRKYFYTDGTNKFGPFTLDELQAENIDRETKVWFQELDDWKSAGDVSELIDIFQLVPPPLSQTSSINDTLNNASNSKPPKTWLIESILVTLFCCLPFGIAGIVNAAKVESRFYAGDFEGAQRSSKEAKKWTTISFYISIGFGVLYLLAVFASAANGY